jgi:DNA phosphorothioation-associated DGQHR protein 1
MSATLNDDGISYTLHGTQRSITNNRVPQISDYIDRFDSTFPNSIILAANFPKEPSFSSEEEDGAESTDLEKMWSVVENDRGEYTMHIPTAEKLAAIIDGQHRLFAFTKAQNNSRLDMGLICAIFLDLPKPFQAQIFATINSNQKPVDKSLTYELFGYNIAEEKPEFWTPDKLAVFISRKLATEESSPLRGKIVVAPKRDARLAAMAANQRWKVSTAVIVEGILRLISSNPKRDSNIMLTPFSQPRLILREKTKDKSPLRFVYFDVNDAVLHMLVRNYLIACDEVFWSRAGEGSFIFKTVGVQALFDVLRKICLKAYEGKDISAHYFKEILAPAGTIDFADERFRNASGSGRSAIKREIEERLGL